MVNREEVIIINLFQKRFIQAKEASGLKWVDIAKKSGLDKASISQYKNGVHIPDSDALYRISDALNVSMEWLTGADVPMKTEENKILNQYHQLNDLGRLEFTKFINQLLMDTKYKR